MTVRIFTAMAGALLCAQPAFADCLDDAARFHHVNVVLVRAIAQQESGMRANAVNRNTDGSEDIGLMQINSSWLPKLRRYGVTRDSLFNPCVNGYVGTGFLRRTSGSSARRGRRLVRTTPSPAINNWCTRIKSIGASCARPTDTHEANDHHAHPSPRALIAQVFALITLTGIATASFSQSQLSPPNGSGWQMLSGPAPELTGSLAMVSPAPGVAKNTGSVAEPAAARPTPTVPASALAAVTPVVLPAAVPAMPASLTLAITPQDINLRNALDRWLQQQGWQLAWKIDDDLPWNSTLRSAATSTRC